MCFVYFVVFEWPTYALNCEKLPTCLNTHMRTCEVWNKNSFRLKPSVKFYLKVFSHRFLMELFNKHIVKSVVKILNCCSLLIQTRRLLKHMLCAFKLLPFRMVINCYFQQPQQNQVAFNCQLVNLIKRERKKVVETQWKLVNLFNVMTNRIERGRLAGYVPCKSIASNFNF